MNHVVVAAAAVNTTPLAWKQNLSAILGAVEDAAQMGVEILCLPELCLTGYGCEDAFPSAALLRKAQKQLDALIEGMRKAPMTVAVGLPLMYQNALFNVTAVIYRGKLIGLVPKQHLAADGLHYEPRWFREWPAGKRGEVTIGNRTYPIGDLIFNVNGVRIGFEVCEDAWVADRPGARLARRGVDVILNPSASHFAFGKHEIRERFVLEGSRAFAVTYVYANLLGNEAGRAIYDGDTLIASGGRLLAQGQRFSYQPYVLTTAEVDIEATRTTQLRTGSYRPSFDEDGVVTECGDSYQRQEYPMPPPPKSTLIQTRGGWVRQDWPDPTPSPNLSETDKRFIEFESAVSLGLWDYMRKTGSHGFVISLSGGADSAACAYLVRKMVEYGIRDLGVQSFARSIGFDPANVTTIDDFMPKLLTCVYQGTENSSETTLKAAKAVAADVGATFHVLDVQPVVTAYTKMVSEALGQDLTWANADVALQNIQARARAPSVWMFANLKNALLVTTSNRSEASVGYCTMDGDTAGSLSPIGGIDKPFIRDWLAWLAPFRHALILVVQQQPTAELRPSAETQTDEKDLMPYEVLNAAEKALVIGKKSPLEVYRTLRAAFPVYSNEDLHTWVKRYFTLWCRNQWKRERFAPSLHLDDENLDPKTWCRFPILSGGYREELADLDKALDEKL